MEKKIIIVAAGKNANARVSEAIYKAGLDEEECVIVENLDELKGIVPVINPRIKEWVEEDKFPNRINSMESMKSLRNYEKQNSQQGWKNKPKHKR